MVQAQRARDLEQVAVVQEEAAWVALAPARQVNASVPVVGMWSHINAVFPVTR